jgi:hypothetical protein
MSARLRMKLPAGEVTAQWDSLDAIVTDRPVTADELFQIVTIIHEQMRPINRLYKDIQ